MDFCLSLWADMCWICFDLICAVIVGVVFSAGFTVGCW